MCLLRALWATCQRFKCLSSKGRKGSQLRCGRESLTRFQNLYQLTDAQLLEVARFSCKGEYAALWAGLLPADLTLHDFKELFKAEFAMENHDKLMGELLKATQKGLVGEYATDMMRYFKVLDLGEEARVRHFVRGLKFGIKETVMASGPTNFLQAVKKAKEVEQAYELGDNRPPLDGLNGRIEDQVVTGRSDKRLITLKLRIGTEMFGVSEGQTLDLRRALLPKNQRTPMKGQGGAALKEILLLISRQ
jgi:hypothetical protein